MRNFTIYPQQLDAEAEPSFAIKATYPEPERTRRYGALQVCTGWTRDRVLERFRRLNRHDAVAQLARDLTAGLAVTVQMGRQELALWNYA